MEPKRGANGRVEVRGEELQDQIQLLFEKFVFVGLYDVVP